MFKDYKRRDFVVDYINEFLVELEYVIDIYLVLGVIRLTFFIVRLVCRLFCMFINYVIFKGVFIF